MTLDHTGAVHAVWSEVLEVDRIEPSDDFFDLGGHSLTAMQVSARLRERLGGVRVPTRLLFANRTFESFAAAVNERARTAAAT
jgi:acyl carrier protein